MCSPKHQSRLRHHVKYWTVFLPGCLLLLLADCLVRWSIFTPLLEVCDPEGASRIQIQGPCCPFCCFSNQQFQIVSNIGEQIGTIWKKWPGFSDERNMDHEYSGVEGGNCNLRQSSLYF
ncbi:hypothetical protein ATANTOWER_028965 [Ataeniobius toweri]|uniref:Phospholipid scramblase n=1 Tax=Ataeniobius toweri TaxID=208326 RepID=A0ABU7BC07_9TELE|nr:hypothetical protein [Ataeniobius toweri]